jgi:glutaredoxin
VTRSAPGLGARLSLVLALVAMAFVVSLGALGMACKRSSASAAVADKGGDEPTVVVKPESEGLLLTWIDDKGDFHVETRVADVPLMGRDCVRVVDPNAEESRGDRVVVADLRQTGAAGAYPVRAMPRADFEAMAVARREKAGPTLAGGGPSAPPPGAPPPAGQEPPAAAPGIRGGVVIYGAEWCGACHDAARYLRRKGVAYVEKDIEKDADAAREMQAKLARNGLRAGSIPVIDVRGKVMVGFNAAEIDKALGAAL